MEKEVFLMHKQAAIAVTFFNFKDSQSSLEIALRVQKSSSDHDQWAALEEGKKYTIKISEVVAGEPEANE
jgi:hypothetical protein